MSDRSTRIANVLASQYDDEDVGPYLAFTASNYGRVYERDGRFVSRSYSTTWEFMDDLPEFIDRLPGKTAQLWRRKRFASYHESLVEYTLKVLDVEGATDRFNVLEMLEEWRFTTLEDCVRRAMGAGSLQPPDNMPHVTPSGTRHPAPDERKYGESSQQYWDRMRDEKTGRHHYRREGD